MSKEWKTIYLFTKPEHEEAVIMPFGMCLGNLLSFRHKCLAQPLQAVAAGALEKRGLGTLVVLTAHNYSIT